MNQKKVRAIKNYFKMNDSESFSENIELCEMKSLAIHNYKCLSQEEQSHDQLSKLSC